MLIYSVYVKCIVYLPSAGASVDAGASTGASVGACMFVGVGTNTSVGAGIFVDVGVGVSSIYNVLMCKV